MKKIISTILSLLLVLNVATFAYAQETASIEKLEDVHQYEEQPDDDIAELTNEIIDEKDFSLITSSRSPINDSIEINTEEFSKNSADQNTRLPSLKKVIMALE